MKLKKICATIATLVLAGVAYADMTVLGWPGGPEEKALNKLVEQYNATQGVIDKNKVKTIYFSRGDFFDKLMNDLAAGSKEFDVNLLATYNVGRYAPFLDELPASVVANAKKSFPASVLSTQQYKGKQYGIPTDLSLHFMYFRQDLIKKLLEDKAWQAKYQAISKKHMGITMSPKNPQSWTWDDFKATALFFTKSINPDSPVRYGTALQLKNLLFNIMIWQSAAYSEGGNWMQDDNLTLQSEAFKKGLETFKFLVDKGATPKGSSNYEYAEANSAFGSGQTAFMLQWNAAYSELNDPAKYSASAGKIGVAPPPAGSKGHATHIHTLGLGINKASENKESVNKFLNWMAKPEAMKIYLENGGVTPLKTEHLGAAANELSMQRMAEYSSKYGFVMNGGSSANALKIYEIQAAEFTAYWSGQKTVDQALKDAESKMKPLLAP